MSCYRSGGCGPYENRSCMECPASKPEYLNRKNIMTELKRGTGMKIFIVCSKKNYGLVPSYKAELEKLGHEVFLPNCMDDAESEQKAKDAGNHIEFKQRMYKQSDETIEQMDAIFVLNPDRDGVPGYIGGATFLEMYDAFRHEKKIFALNKIVQSAFCDETDGFGYTVISEIADVK